MLEQESDKLNGELGRGIEKEKNPKVLKENKKGTWIDSVGVGYGDWRHNLTMKSYELVNVSFFTQNIKTS